MESLLSCRVVGRSRYGTLNSIGVRDLSSSFNWSVIILLMLDLRLLVILLIVLLLKLCIEQLMIACLVVIRLSNVILSILE